MFKVVYTGGKLTQSDRNNSLAIFDFSEFSWADITRQDLFNHKLQNTLMVHQAQRTALQPAGYRRRSGECLPCCPSWWWLWAVAGLSPPPGSTLQHQPSTPECRPVWRTAPFPVREPTTQPSVSFSSGAELRVTNQKEARLVCQQDPPDRILH